MCAEIINLKDYERTCRNCIYYAGETCEHPGGWTLNKNNECAEFRRKRKQRNDILQAGGQRRDGERNKSNRRKDESE